MVRSNFRKTIGIWIVSIVGLIILGYGYFEARYLISGPQITVAEPLDGTETTIKLIDISGKVQNITLITLNDRQIFIDENGNFREPFLLSPGYNIVRLDAKDKFGRTNEKVIELVYNPSLQFN
jgi:hypothetical protein